jgi:hypothetical protein
MLALSTPLLFFELLLLVSLFVEFRLAIRSRCHHIARFKIALRRLCLMFPRHPNIRRYVCFYAGYFVWWIYTCLLLFSVQTPVVIQNPTFTFPPKPSTWPMLPVANAAGKYGFMSSTWDTSLQQSLAIHFFHLLWTVQFAVFFCFLTIAGAVANWYFTPWNADQTEKPRGDDEGQLPDSPIYRSCCRAIRYNLGTVSFAAFIIAVIQFIQACILYAEQKAKESGMNETLRKIVFCLLMCFMKCVECCMKQVNRNALVFVAVYGTPFCPAACGAFVLAFANLGRVAWITMVGDFLMGIGKVLIALLSTGIFGLILFAAPYNTTVSTPAFVLVIIFILSWGVASVFMTVYECSIDTVFMCFLIDEDNNKGGKMLGHKDLLTLIDETANTPEAKVRMRRLIGRFIGDAM